MTDRIEFSAKDVDLTHYGLQLTQLDVNRDMLGGRYGDSFHSTTVTLSFENYSDKNNTTDGLQLLMKDLQLLGNMRKASSSKSEAVIQQLKQLKLLLELSK